MTDKQLEYLANKIADLVVEGLSEKQKQWDDDLVKDLKSINNSSEEKLLSELAQAMTALDYNLKQENYKRCLELQEEIKNIEDKLTNFK
tara:strand:+ start:206 stop:472 length:267 start_codon:yes stop_codon:yes gene_type:complete